MVGYYLIVFKNLDIRGFNLRKLVLGRFLPTGPYKLAIIPLPQIETSKRVHAYDHYIPFFGFSQALKSA